MPQPPLSFKKRLQSGAALMLGKALLHGVGGTMRVRRFYRGREVGLELERSYLDQFRRDGGPLLFALWHGSCLPMLYYWRGRGLCVVTSRSADGQILARLLRGLGYVTVAGSSTRGGTRALIDVAREVMRGRDAAIAVDGPRGPAFAVKPGIVLLAKVTGRPIVPVASCARRFWQFQSWDRFRMPLPLSRVVISGADPIHVPADADRELIEARRAELERTLRELQKQTDDDMRPRIWRLPDRRPRDKQYWQKAAELEGEGSDPAP